MRNILIAMIIIVLLAFSGCAYKDMNRLQFTTLALFDETESGEIIIYSELFTSDRGDGKDLGIAKRVIVQGAGETIGEAFYKNQGSSSMPTSYDVNKVIIFSEKAARGGLEDHIGAFDRNQKPTLKQYMYILEGNPVELMHTKLEDEEFIGVYLDEMMVFQSTNSRIISTLLNEYLNERLCGCTVAVVPIIKKSITPTSERIEVSGAAVLVRDRMVEKLSSDEVATYKLLENKLKLGDATVKNPQEIDKLVSFLVLSNKTKMDIVYNGDEVILNTKINTLYSVQSAQGKLDVSDDKVEEELIKLAEEDIKERCSELFMKYQEKGIDLLNVEKKLKRKYPNVKLDDIINKTTLNLDVTVKIDGSENMTKTR